MNLEDMLLKAPCPFCGYSGSGFYKERTHASACPYYSVSGYNERKEMLVPFLVDIVKQYMESIAEEERVYKEGKITGKFFVLYDGRAKTGGYDAAAVYVTASSLAEAVEDGQDEAWQDGIWYEWDQWDEDGVITLINPVARWDLPPANKRGD
jgi:hypothetical protein